MRTSQSTDTSAGSPVSTGLSQDLASSGTSVVAAGADRPGSDVREIEISKIRKDGETQTRSAIDKSVVEDYAEAMKAGSAFPPVTVYLDGDDYWIADGFHRLEAAIQTGATTIRVEIKKGSKLDAIRHALGANVHHGLRRTNADKRRCVELALKYFADQSDRALAELCGVGNQLVGEVRKLCESHSSETRTGKDGKTRKQKKRKKKKDESASSQNAKEADSKSEGTTGDACAVSNTAFLLLDGTSIEAEPGYFGTEWLKNYLHGIREQMEPLTAAQREWGLQRQRLILEVASLINARLGENPSYEALHGTSQVLCALLAKTSESFAAQNNHRDTEQNLPND